MARRYISISSLITALSGLPANVRSMSYAVEDGFPVIPIVSAHSVDASGNATETVVRYIDLTVPSASTP